MTQNDEFVIEMITNVVILTRLDENVSKTSFLDINFNNFLLTENVNIFLLEENLNTLHLTKMSINYHYWMKISVLFSDLDISIFLLD